MTNKELRKCFSECTEWLKQMINNILKWELTSCFKVKKTPLKIEIRIHILIMKYTPKSVLSNEPNLT